MKRHSTHKNNFLFFYCLVILVGIFAIQGLRKNPNISNSSSETLKKLESRVKKLEKRTAISDQSKQKGNEKSKYGPIRSLTFRIGTRDDRLRIYWENGEKSDLPCTKEQSIWVCG